MLQYIYALSPSISHRLPRTNVQTTVDSRQCLGILNVTALFDASLKEFTSPLRLFPPLRIPGE